MADERELSTSELEELFRETPPSAPLRREGGCSLATAFSAWYWAERARCNQPGARSASRCEGAITRHDGDTLHAAPATK